MAVNILDSIMTLVSQQSHYTTYSLTAIIQADNCLKRILQGPHYKCHHYTILSKYLAWPYCDICNISCTLVGNWAVDHSDALGALLVCAALTTSLFSTWLQWIGQILLQDWIRNFEASGFGALVSEIWWYSQQVKGNFILFHLLIYVLPLSWL